MAEPQAYQPWHQPLHTDPAPPASLRICSLLPSATDIVSRLGLTAQLVCITHCCDAGFDQAGLQRQLNVGQTRRVTSSWIRPNTMSQADIDAMVKGTFHKGQPLYGIDADAMAEKQPTLVITQDLCDVCAPNSAQASAACASANGTHNGSSGAPGTPHIISTSPCSLLELADSFVEIAAACNVRHRGEQMRQQFLQDLHRVCRAVSGAASPDDAAPTVFTLEWIDPPFDAGHWVPELVQIASGHPELSSCHQELADLGKAEPNGAALQQKTAAAQWSGSTKSKQVTWQDIAEKDPDVLISCCCGFDVARNKQDATPVLQQHTDASNLRAVQQGRVFAIDGNRTLSRPGPCLVEGAVAVAACMWSGHKHVQTSVLQAFPSLDHELGPHASLLWSKLEL